MPIAKENLPRIFMHFFDRYHYYLAVKMHRYPRRLVDDELRLAFRIAFLLSSELLLSGSAFFENRVARRIILDHQEISEAGFLFVTARDETLAEHFERKRLAHYGDESPDDIRAAYRKLRKVPILYRAANILTAGAIRYSWREALERDDLAIVRRADREPQDISALERVWTTVPEVVGKRALVLPHFEQAFKALGVEPPSPHSLMSILDPAYTSSHTIPLGCEIVGDLLFTQPPWRMPHVDEAFSYKTVQGRLRRLSLLDDIRYCAPEDLLRLGTSLAWASLTPYVGALGSDIEAKPSTGVVSEAMELIGRRSLRTTLTRSEFHPTIGIVTALPIEWLAVVTSLTAEDAASIAGDPNRYAHASVVSRLGKVEIVVTFLPRMGTNSASAASTNLLRSFPSVSDLIFCGIACGCPDPSNPSRHVRLGDIVVSDMQGLVQVDQQVFVGNRTENRSSMPIPSRRLLNGVRMLQASELEGRRPWEETLNRLVGENETFKRPPRATDVLLDDVGQAIAHPPDAGRRRGRPRVFQGVIGSSNSLIRSIKVRETYSKQFGLRCIEMEGAGTAEAVWQFGKSYLIVRGIADYGDDRTKSDQWHGYAAAVSASYARALIEQIGTDS